MTAAERLLELLDARNVSLSTAESCTGGLIGCIITDVPGASAHYMGGAVAYSNEAKVRVLGVPEGILLEHGAVSPETAVAMAEGALRAFGSDVSVAVTGIAGPGGAVPGKPVGLVYVAVAGMGPSEVVGNVFPGTRQQVREATASKAISMVIGRLE
jgi:nicotinamide-nucleotide amidase